MCVCVFIWGKEEYILRILRIANDDLFLFIGGGGGGFIFIFLFLIASVLRTLVSVCPDRHVNVCLFGSTSVRVPCGVIADRLAGTL